MDVNRQELRDFVEKNGSQDLDCQDVDRLMTILKPFFEIAEAGKCKLSRKPTSSKTVGRIKKAIALAIDQEVREVVFVSCHKPFPKPEWMPQKVYEDSLLVVLWDSLRTIFRFNLETSLAESFGKNFGANLEANLEANLGANLGVIFMDSFQASLGTNLLANLGGYLGTILLESFQTSLYYFIAFSLLNDKAKIEQLKPLLRILPKYIPLGNKKDDQATWLVLCR